MTALAVRVRRWSRRGMNPVRLFLWGLGLIGVMMGQLDYALAARSLGHALAGLAVGRLGVACLQLAELGDGGEW